MTIVTIEDLNALKNELLEEIRKISASNNASSFPFMRTKDVKKLLGCSDSKLETLRRSGKLKFAKIDGTLYYKFDDILSLFETSYAIC